MAIQKFKAIGLMSGTSLDGLDIAYCIFEKSNTEWTFGIEKSVSIPYTQEWKDRLTSAFHISGLELSKLDHDLGALHGSLVRDFIEENQLEVDLIASHGHTIFHQPEKGITTQIGHPSKIAGITGCTVVADFRTLDVALGGQGAPLVPIGDRFLFSSYDACLNLGGIANISFEKVDQRIAFDIAPCNMLWNYLSHKMGLEFDENGDIAKGGKVVFTLLEKWNSYNFYSSPYPKSLGREFFENNFKEDLDSNLTVQDLMATATQHIVDQVSRVVNDAGVSRLLVTGGGAKNSFFIKKLSESSQCQVIVPDPQVVDFKEALIFAFLGVLRSLGEINTLSSVTGARSDSSGGSIWNATN